jgi:hypothetical protein
MSWLRRLYVVLSGNLVPFLNRKKRSVDGLLEIILMLMCDEGKIGEIAHVRVVIS